MEYAQTGSDRSVTNTSVVASIKGELSRDRKKRRFLGSTGELIWSPELEAALMDGLREYQPHFFTRHENAIGRFPQRNRWLSEHISKVTGKYRTPKQVGAGFNVLEHLARMRKVRRFFVSVALNGSHHLDLSLVLRILGAPRPRPRPSSIYPSPCRDSSPSQLSFSGPLDHPDDLWSSPLVDCAPAHTSVNIHLHDHTTDTVAYFWNIDGKSDIVTLSQTPPRFPLIDTTLPEATFHSSRFVLNGTAPIIFFTSPVAISSSDCLSWFQATVRGTVLYAEYAKIWTEPALTSHSRLGSGCKSVYESRLGSGLWGRLQQLGIDDIYECIITHRITRRDSMQLSSTAVGPMALFSLSYRFTPSTQDLPSPTPEKEPLTLDTSILLDHQGNSDRDVPRATVGRRDDQNLDALAQPVYDRNANTPSPFHASQENLAGIPPFSHDSTGPFCNSLLGSNNSQVQENLWSDFDMLFAEDLSSNVLATISGDGRGSSQLSWTIESDGFLF
ncbi:hypothetical protein AAF712_009343 [Marasmius tenuissimus]|uniref:TEA domain-containing protein n=1 Tax=Marasmius tenuissimus TaxID=585030 RepID=A0ABR2ZQ26_9AGAR